MMAGAVSIQCDVCGEVIRNGRTSHVLWDSRWLEHGRLTNDLVWVHRGECDEVVDAGRVMEYCSVDEFLDRLRDTLEVEEQFTAM